MSKINKRLAMEKATKNTEILPKEKEDPILDHVISQPSTEYTLATSLRRRRKQYEKEQEH